MNVPHPSAIETLREQFDRMHERSRSVRAPDIRQRREHLRALDSALDKFGAPFADAAFEDFGGRHRQETRILDLLPSRMLCRHAARNLPAWAQPERRSTHWAALPSSAQVEYVPLGVVGVMSPWNYPVLLAMGAVVGALAAGNRVLVKPSEVAPACAQVWADMIADTFDADHVGVTNGGVDVARAFSALPFDHLFFTGSTRVGREVMKAAAENLTPVTLELGGKSPCVLGPDYPIDVGAYVVTAAKCFNAGQTCVAPDVLFVPKAKKTELIAGMKKHFAVLFPAGATSPEYTPIINEREYDRLNAWVQEACDGGAEAVQILDGDGASARKIAPTLIFDAPAESKVMREEIFGPLLPVVTYESTEEVFSWVKSQGRPLAAYVFSHDDDFVREFSARVTSGALGINGGPVYVGQPDLRFGGVGTSGMGGYQGRDGFLAFSHQKLVYRQGRPNLLRATIPPYDKPIKKRIIDFLMRFA